MPSKNDKPELQFPCDMYLRSVNGDNMTHIVATGQTSRSWVTGTEWDPYKWAKCDYSLATKEEYDLWWWACVNRYRIAQAVGYYGSTSPAQLKAVAELIGYKEEAK